MSRSDGGSQSKSNAIEIPGISLPSGGGAIKGIDEKFSVNTVNGTATFSIPLPFSPVRGAAPEISLSYNSGSGNGIFGLGWSLGTGSIKRKTDKRLPQYNDGDDSDTFLFFGAEDLVPEFKKASDGTFEKDANNNYVINEKDAPDNNFRIRFYKPRIEGLFARIERWTDKTTQEIKWRVISRDNVTTLFGWNSASRIADPKDDTRIFEWLPELMFDDKGNCARYLYKKDDELGFDNSMLHNRNRIKNGIITWSNAYPEKILYGNKTPYSQFGDAVPDESDFLFSTVFDYGEYNPDSPFDKNSDWDFRDDAFSDYRAGFEIRTTRLCKRVLLFHHFTGAGEYDGLVKSLNFEYDSNLKEFTFLKSVTSYGYIKKQDGSYSSKHMPPLEFSYQQHDWNSEIKTVNAEELANLPAGLDMLNYQFTDLYNEGISGILTEQANAWFYKRNLGNGKFEAAKLVLEKPSFSGFGTSLKLTDLDADGGRQLVNYDSKSPGFFELDDSDKWLPFRAFKKLPNINMSDPNTRLLDLNGDGKPEVVITEDNVISWYASEGRKGLSAKQNALKPLDEEEGPRLVFADLDQTIFLADMSGDGLTDLVRIRNSEICYWPNIGYGKFGPKVTFDNAPAFDNPESFNPSYIRLADIDGSGNADIIYLGKSRFSCWKNQSGNRFSEPFEIDPFSEINSKVKVVVTDLLGTGVSCIVWSSPLEKDATARLKYIDLMNGKKPHVLVSWKNNLGKEVTMEYLPSTKFYIDDKASGNPWATKLHFPVQCVSKTVTEDKITGHRFVCSYTYHHGYFDHAEQEFRGFGMVEQTDSETFEHWKKGNASNIVEEDLHQEPVITKTWFHTGAFLGKEDILEKYKNEFWFRVLEKNGFPSSHSEKELPGIQLKAAPGLDTALTQNLSGEEWQEAFRACKSFGLRTEVFAKDAVKSGNTAEAQQKELTPYSVTSQNCVIELIQPKGNNRHAVFVAKRNEAVSYNYERKAEDPRISHSINTKLDEFGNILESVAIVYPRKSPDLSLPAETRQEQNKTIVIFKRNRFTNDVISDSTYRLRLPSEIETFELKGVGKTGAYYSPDDFDDVLSDANSDTALYHETNKSPNPGKALKRRIEHTRFNYYKNDLTGALPLHQIESLAFPFENYQLAFTPDLVSDIYGTKVNDALFTEAKFVHSEGDNNWWIRSGTKRFIQGAETPADAAVRFYTAVAYVDPYGSETKVKYYGNYFLFIEETENSLGNKTGFDVFNFRTLSPQRIHDVNGNLYEVISNELGMLKAMAVFGKGAEADELTGLTEETDSAENTAIQDFFNAADSVQLTNRGKNLLQRATIRFVYNLENYQNNGEPVVMASVSREEHFQTNNNSPVQLSFEYSGGMGEVVMKKIQAEPGNAKQVTVNPDDSVTINDIDTAGFNPKQLRWIGNGRTIKNNKGNPVKQYEPYFSVTHRYESFKELVETGVTPVMYYDAPGRLVRTEMPNGTFSKVEFDSWKQTTFDANDTTSEPECSWYLKRTNRLIDAELTAAGKDPVKEKQAADKAAKHAGTPNSIHFDSLGRPALSVIHNKNENTNADEFLLSQLNTDVEGNLTRVTDARGNVVTQYKYDILGNQVYQKSMDAGQRWQLINIIGNPYRAWDERNHEFQYNYDIMHRPTHSVIINGDGPVPLNNIFQRIIYAESLLLSDRSNEASLKAKNILGRSIQKYDTGGLLDVQQYNFNGYPQSTTRKLFSKYKEIPNWTDANLTNDLEPDSNTFTTETDALGRVSRQIAPDGSIIIPAYNEAALLNSQSVLHQGDAAATLYIKNITYNEKGQREKIVYGNDITTKFYFDKETFRPNRIECKRLNNDPLQDWRYTYDAVGNITHIEDVNVPVVFYDNQKITGLSEYTYNALYQLISATGRENNSAMVFGSGDNWNDSSFMHQLNPGDPMAMRTYNQHYLYDEAGNIIQMKHVASGNNWTRNYTYETVNNRLKSTGIGDNGNPANYTNYQYHPQHGFLVSLPHLNEIEWNFKEELVKSIRQNVSPGNGTAETTYYQYDGQGQRIRKLTENSASAGETPIVKEERIYLGGYEIYRKHSGANSGLERISLSLMDNDHRFVIIETRNDVNDGTEKQLVRYQLSNHIGSAALELDNSARIISYEEYHPYGTTAFQAVNATIKSAAKRYRYTGMERDEETGLEYHSARYYMPWLGRWLSSDPIGISDGLNVYAYCRGNPVSFNDSSGQSSGDEEKPAQVLDLEKMFGIPDSSAEESKGFFDQIADTLSSIVTAIGEAIVAAGKWIAETASKFWDWIKDTATKAWNWIKQAASDAWNWIKGAAEKAWDWTKNAASAAWNWTKEAFSTAWNWIKEKASAAWEWLTKDDGFFEDFLEILGHLTWGLPGTLFGLTVTLLNFTIGNLIVAIHNIFTDDKHDWEYAGISIGGPGGEDDIIGNYGGFLNIAGLGSAITFGPFVYFNGSYEEAVNSKAKSVKDFYANVETPTAGHPYGAKTGLRTADHEEGHEDQNLMYGPFTLLMGLVFSLVPNAIGANTATSGWYWYDRQANKLSGKNSVLNPNKKVHP